MPKSRRASVVSLTKTARADRRRMKQDLAARIHEGVDSFGALFVFSFANLRSSHFKQLRAEFAADSRFLLGKNKVIALALTGGEGSAPYRAGLDALAGDLVGNVGLLFTSRAASAVADFFARYSEPDFARAGFVPDRTLTLPAGRLEFLPHTMADELRKMGVNVRLDKGVVVIVEETALCSEGVPITPEQGRLLQLFGHRLAAFRVTLVSMWRRAAGKGADENAGGVYTRIAPKDGGEAAAGGMVEDVEEEEEEEAPPVAAKGKGKGRR